MSPPFLLAQALQSTDAQIILVGCFPVSHVGQLHGHDDAVRDQCGAETGPQTQKKQQAALIASQGLHGRIIEDLDWAAKSFFKIEADPTRRQIVWFSHHASADNDSGVADRNRVIIPIPSQLLDPGDHQLGSHGWSGGKLPRLGKNLALPFSLALPYVTGGNDLDTRSSHIND